LAGRFDEFAVGSEGMKSQTLDEKALRDENSRAQEALRISEERNRDLVENSAYGIFRVSADGSFLDGNPRYRASQAVHRRRICWR
jgi:PAS domain-containing protein